MFIDYLSDRYVKYLIFYINFNIKYNLYFKYSFHEDPTLLSLINMSKLYFYYFYFHEIPDLAQKIFLDIYSIITIDFHQSLKDLTLGDCFNQPITCSSRGTCEMTSSSLNLPSSLKKLTLGRCFDQSLILPQSLKKLTLGNCFNQPLILPQLLEVINIFEKQERLFKSNKKVKINIIH